MDISPLLHDGDKLLEPLPLLERELVRIADPPGKRRVLLDAQYVRRNVLGPVRENAFELPRQGASVLSGNSRNDVDAVDYAANGEEGIEHRRIRGFGPPADDAAKAFVERLEAEHDPDDARVPVFPDGCDT